MRRQSSRAVSSSTSYSLVSSDTIVSMVKFSGSEMFSHKYSLIGSRDIISLLSMSSVSRGMSIASPHALCNLYKSLYIFMILMFLQTFILANIRIIDGILYFCNSNIANRLSLLLIKLRELGVCCFCEQKYSF